MQDRKQGPKPQPQQDPLASLEAQIELILDREGMPPELPLLVDRREYLELSGHGLRDQRRPGWLADDTSSDEDRLDRRLYRERRLGALGASELEAEVVVEKDTDNHHGALYVWEFTLFGVEDLFLRRGRASKAARIVAYSASEEDMLLTQREVLVTHFRFPGWLLRNWLRRRPLKRILKDADRGLRIALHYILQQGPCVAHFGRVDVARRFERAQVPLLSFDNKERTPRLLTPLHEREDSHIRPDSEVIPELSRKLGLNRAVVASALDSWRSFRRERRDLFEVPVDDAIGFKPLPLPPPGPPLTYDELKEYAALRAHLQRERRLGADAEARLCFLADRQTAYLRTTIHSTAH